MSSNVLRGDPGDKQMNGLAGKRLLSVALEGRHELWFGSDSGTIREIDLAG